VFDDEHFHVVALVLAVHLTVSRAWKVPCPAAGVEDTESCSWKIAGVETSHQRELDVAYAGRAPQTVIVPVCATVSVDISISRASSQR